MNRTHLYKLRTTPFGRKRRAYMAAILEVTEMDQGAIFPLQRFFRNFSGHLDEGRIVPANGGYQLTRTGKDYFAERSRASGIERAEVEAMIRGITGDIGTDEWIEIPGAYR